MRRGVLMSLLQENAKSIPMWAGGVDEKFVECFIPRCSYACTFTRYYLEILGHLHYAVV